MTRAPAAWRQSACARDWQVDPCVIYERMVTYIGNLAGIGGVAALREIALVARIEVYSSYFCPYCARAKALLERKGVTFETIDLMEQPSRRAEMIERAGGRTSVPQIFIDGEHIGGCDDLHALDKAGQLDAKLAT